MNSTFSRPWRRNPARLVPIFACPVSVLRVLTLCVVIMSTASTGRLLAELPLQQATEDLQMELKIEPQPHFIVRGAGVGDRDLKTEPPFTITVHDSKLAEPPPLLGRYERVDAQSIAFHPRYPLTRSVRYQVVWSEELNERSSKPGAPQWLFQLPQIDLGPPVQVSQIYPTAAELPENLLKFYIYFSAPMSRGRAYEHIQLLRDGDVVEAPFLELGEELWNPEQTRFTLFLHPGRIKRGLRPRDESGPPLEAGREYSLRIDAEWRDAKGRPLAKAFEKRFKAGPADEQQVTPEQWKIATPDTGSRDPVQLTFDEPLDYAMLTRVLEVKHREGHRIPGAIEVGEHESSWQFSPEQPWKTGTYYIEIGTHLEDLCGNSLARPFEVSMQNQQTTEEKRPRIAIEFIVK